MSEFESIIDGLDGREIELGVRGDRLLDATVRFWNYSQNLARTFREQGLTYVEAYLVMEQQSGISDWGTTKAEALFTLAWAQQESPES